MRSWRCFASEAAEKPTRDEAAAAGQAAMDAAVEAAGGDEAAAAAGVDASLKVKDVSPAALEDAGEIQIQAPDDGSPKEYPPHLEHIAEEISKLSLLEVSDLVDCLQERLGLPDVSMMSMGGGGGGAAAEAVEEEVVVEKTEFDLKLAKFEPKSKIKLIKEVRQIADLGLKEAKALVESAPCVVKKALTKDEAEELKKKLEELGAECELE
jgi:large subunit ribosomal protein L7/L12